MMLRPFVLLPERSIRSPTLVFTIKQCCTYSRGLRGRDLLSRAPFSLAIGLVFFIPGTIPELTGNAWRLVLWFTVTNFGW